MENRSKTVYECPYCRGQYDEYDDAADCAKDCVDVESPIERKVFDFRCEYCKKVFDDEDECLDCERWHIETQDMHFCQVVDAREKEKLMVAAQHPEQRKLI